MRVGVNGDSVAPMESHDNLGEEGLNSIEWTAPTMMKRRRRSVAEDVLLLCCCCFMVSLFVDYCKPITIIMNEPQLTTSSGGSSNVVARWLLVGFGLKSKRLLWLRLRSSRQPKAPQRQPLPKVAGARRPLLLA